MFKCELIENGIVKERFFREGDSIEDVRKGLEIFQWPCGEWCIEEVE